MLFISLWIYIILWYPCYIFGRVLSPFKVISVWFYPPIFYLLSLLLSLLVLYIVHSFQQDAKPFFKRLIRIQGVRWIAFLTCIMALASLIAINFLYGSSPGIFGILLPIAVISLLNALGIEYLPQMLRIEEVTPETVNIPGEPEPLKFPHPTNTHENPDFPEVPGDIVKEFKWEYKEQPYQIKLVIRKSIYDNFSSKERILRDSEWAREYAAGGICAETRELIHNLLYAGKPYGSYEEVDFVLSFVQNIIKYESDQGEYPKYPIETLVEEKGDCEDFSILGASILKVMGYDAALLFLPGHVALGIADVTEIPGTYVEYGEKRYYYREMTAAGWDTGKIPKEFENVRIIVNSVPGIIMDVDLPNENSVSRPLQNGGCVKH